MTKASFDVVEDSHIHAKIAQNYGLGRLFRELKARHPHIGESVLIAKILHISRGVNHKFPLRTVERVLRETDEHLPNQTKRWLLDIKEERIQ